MNPAKFATHHFEYFYFESKVTTNESAARFDGPFFSKMY